MYNFNIITYNNEQLSYVIIKYSCIIYYCYFLVEIKMQE